MTIANPTRALRSLLLTLGLLLVVACGPELLTTPGDTPDPTAPPASELSPDHVLHFDHGYWSEAPRAQLHPGDEYLDGQRLFVHDHEPSLRLADVSPDALRLASQPWEPGSDRITPSADDIVMVVGDTHRHTRLRDVHDGERLAFAGRIFHAEHRSDDQLALTYHGETVHRVVRTFRHDTNHLVDLTVEDPATGESGTLTATPSHPFFVFEKGGFVPVGQLEPGTTLRNFNNTPLRVVSTEHRLANDEVFNLEVADARNYFVGADGGGRQAMLAHNKAAYQPNLTTRIPGSQRKLTQLRDRGWSQQSIDDLVNNPHTTRTSTNRANDNPATAYFRDDGHYIVRDDVTGELVQMSDTRLGVGYGPGQWRPDSGINNPFIPE